LTLCVSLKVWVHVSKYELFYPLIPYIAHVLLYQLCQSEVPGHFNVVTK